MQPSIFFIHPCDAKAKAPEKYFTGVRVEVDKRFSAYIELGGRSFSTPRFRCTVITPSSPIDADDVFLGIMKGLPSGDPLDVRTLHALLDFLGSADGMEILAIPEGEEEINLVLGYMHAGGKRFVLFIEHEFEHGEREIHLHARPAGSWDDDLPRALLILGENA